MDFIHSCLPNVYYPPSHYLSIIFYTKLIRVLTFRITKLQKLNETKYGVIVISWCQCMGMVEANNIKFCELRKCVYLTNEDANEHCEGHIVLYLFMNAKRCVICTINCGNWVVQQGMHYQFEIYVCIAI
jgi:hypothetical protein